MYAALLIFGATDLPIVSYLLLSKIVPRTRREITLEFWQWLEEQMKKIVVELEGKNQLIYCDNSSSGNLAQTTEHRITGHIMSKGIFDADREQILRYTARGRFAATADNKTLTFVFGGTSLLTSGVLANAAIVNWQFEVDIHILTKTTQYAVATLLLNTGAVTMSHTSLTLSIYANNNTFEVKATSGVATANQIICDILTAEAKRIQKA